MRCFVAPSWVFVLFVFQVRALRSDSTPIASTRASMRYHPDMHLPTPSRLALISLAGLLCLASSCQSGAPGEGVQAERVILVSYDGVGADLAWQWVVDGVAAKPDGLATMAREGFSVRRLRMNNPTLTAVNHAVLATGRMPSDTGVVSNSYRPPGAALGSRTNGFNAVPDPGTPRRYASGTPALHVQVALPSHGRPRS